MSALAGIVRFDGGPADPVTVARMLDCVERRGGDWRDAWTDGSVAMGFRWRRTGSSQLVEEQPIVDRMSRSAIVFDGRLDNREELEAVIGLDGGADRLDAHIVLAAYRRWGSDAVARLLGDFAFAIWDGREQRLILARDPLGVRAISYAITAEGIAFATEPRQLLRVEGIEPVPNLGFFTERLVGLITHPSDTVFRNIQRVPAAHVVTATSFGVQLTRYWDIDPGREVRYADDRDYAEHLQTLSADAIRARLRGLDRVGVLLSGGVDSSCVASMMARSDPGGSPVAVRAYTYVARGFPDADEEHYAVDAARFCGVPLVRVPFESTSAEAHRELARLLEDTSAGALGSDSTMAAHVAADECRVLFTGIGGDEWFTGVYQHSADLLRTGRLIRAVRQLWADGRHPDVSHGMGVLTRSCVWVLVPPRARRLIKSALPERDLVPRGVNRAFAQRVSFVDRTTRPLIDRRFPTLAAGAAYMNATHPQGIYAWEESGRQAAHFGYELSAPLLDRRLAEFAMALPEEQRWAGHDTKRVLRAAVNGMLPESVRMRRRKSDPCAVQVAELGRMRAEGAFEAMDLVDAGVLDPVALETMHQEMVGLFAEGHSRYKFLADRLWGFFVGECIWRALFGRDAGASTASTPFAMASASW